MKKLHKEHYSLLVFTIGCRFNQINHGHQDSERAYSFENRRYMSDFFEHGFDLDLLKRSSHQGKKYRHQGQELLSSPSFLLQAKERLSPKSIYLRLLISLEIYSFNRIRTEATELNPQEIDVFCL